MSDATRALVRALYDAYGKRDFDRVASLIAEGITWMIHGPVQVFPHAGPREGRAAVLATLAAIAAEYEIRRYEAEVVIVEDDRAAVISNVAYIQRSSGRTLSFRNGNFLRFRDGQLADFRQFIDTFDVAEQALGRWLDV